MEIIKKKFEDLSNDVKRLTEENKQLGGLNEKVKKLTEENMVLNNKICYLNKEIENLKNNK
jgi:regulator of replication initiation timing